MCKYLFLIPTSKAMALFQKRKKNVNRNVLFVLNFILHMKKIFPKQWLCMKILKWDFFFFVPTLVFHIQKKIFDIFFFAYSDCAYILKHIFLNIYRYIYVMKLVDFLLRLFYCIRKTQIKLCFQKVVENSVYLNFEL